MSQHYQDVFRLPGRDAIIYKRSDVARPVWYARFKILGERRYVVRSSKTTDFAAAKVWATKEFDRLCFKQEHGLPIFTRSLRDAYEKARSELELDVEVGKAHKQTLANFNSAMSRYVLPFMGNEPIDKIGINTISDFWDWRRRYWIDGAGKASKANHRHVEVPSETTLYQEARALSRCFKEAIRQGWVSKELCPDVFPRVPKKAKRRPAFDEKEWGQLHRGLYLYALEAKREQDKLRRLRLFHFVRAVVSSGMRPPEAKTLTWENVVPFQTPDGKDTYALWVQGKGKQRRIIAQPEIRGELDNWRKITPFNEDTDYVFADDEGKPWEQVAWNFRKALRQLGLERNRHGDAFTVYSLRHTYATFRLMYGDIDIYLLARNMDTGVAMIEAHYGHDDPAFRADDVIRDRKMEKHREYVQSRKWSPREVAQDR